MASGGTGLELAALPARQPAEPLVQRALRRRRQASTTHRHRGACETSGGRAVALSGIRPDSPRGNPQATCQEGAGDLSSQRRTPTALKVQRARTVSGLPSEVTVVL